MLCLVFTLEYHIEWVISLHMACLQTAWCQLPGFWGPVCKPGLHILLFSPICPQVQAITCWSPVNKAKLGRRMSSERDHCLHNVGDWSADGRCLHNLGLCALTFCDCVLSTWKHILLDCHIPYQLINFFTQFRSTPHWVLTPLDSDPQPELAMLGTIACSGAH